MNRAAAKTAVTKAVREAALAGLTCLDGRVRRPRPNAAYIEIDEIYLCLDVQHTQWVTDETLRFCVNIGFVPIRMHEDPEWFRAPAVPSVTTCLIRDRLGANNGSDHWWEVPPPYDLDRVVKEVRDLAERYVAQTVPQDRTLDACLSVASERAWLKGKVDAWRRAHA